MLRRILILTLLFFCYGYSQSDSCGVTVYTELTQTGGLHVTSFGTLKVLFLMIDFCDDNEDPTNPTWPVNGICDQRNNGIGPNFLNDIVDLTENQNSGKYANVTTFFKDMSDEQFTMIGKAYYVRPNQPLSWYVANHPGQEASYSARDAIQQLDLTVDFSDFDRWIDSPSNHTQGQDGVVDMVFICYRLWYLNCGLGCGSFHHNGWYGGSLPGGQVYVDGGARRITSTHSVNVLNMIQYPRMDVVLHEFGHVWGLNHNYSPGLWSLMSQRYNHPTSFMNSYERERMGWIAFHDITTSQTASLRDFGDYPQDAYRINIGSNQYFILENHQRNSIYDNSDKTGSKGLFIIRQFPFGSDPSFEGNLKVETADGRYNWSNPEWVIFPGTNILYPVFKRELSNRTNGPNDRAKLYAIHPVTQDPGYYHLIAKKDEITGQNVYGSFYQGDGRDAFSTTFNNVFTPYSNPSACLWSGALTNIGIEILPSSTDVLDIQFFIGNPLNASPSKPQDLSITIHNTGYNTHPKLNWSGALESDVQSATTGVLIDRKINSGSWTQIAALSGTATQHIDYGVSYAGSGANTASYRMRFKDTQNKISVYSDVKSIQYGDAWKIGVEPEETITEYKLQQNFPNPFNPVTNIVYHLPKSGLVQLKVYDLLGSEVAVLVNEVKSEGLYEINFDASNLPSGVYIYSLRVNDFIQNNKMTLLK